MKAVLVPKEPKFEVVSTYAGSGINLPQRVTKGSAGYDFEAAEDTLIPPYDVLISDMLLADHDNENPKTLDEMSAITKAADAKVTLVPTGVKCKMPEGMYLKLVTRSSLPLKHWLVLANSEGIIDSDYYGPDGSADEGHIIFQYINLSPYPIIIRKGERIGQGIFQPYETTCDDIPGDRERKGRGFGSTNV